MISRMIVLLLLCFVFSLGLNLPAFEDRQLNDGNDNTATNKMSAFAVP